MYKLIKILCCLIPSKHIRHIIKEKFYGISFIKLMPAFIFRLFDYIIPKASKKIIFFSVPNFTDNPKAYYDYLQKYHKNKYDLVWLFHDVYFLKNHYSENIQGYYFYSLKGMWNLLRAKYIVWTHSILLDKYTVGKKHIILQLWHGMPIKTIGFLEKSIPTETLNSYDYFGKNAHFFVTSDIYKQLFISIFRANPDNIHITGQPRTDLCFENNKELSSFLNVDKYKKVVLYMPTYKEALRGNKKDIDAKLENIFYMEDYNDEVFNNFIQNEDILFLLKPHPFDELNYISLRENELIPKNVKLILNLDLVGKGFHLYNLFNFADLLITDFSSIAIDFMILDKPMIFLSNLSEQYSNNRGFLFSHNCHRFMLGDSVQNFATLVRVMEKNLKEDLWKNKRKQEISLMHEYLDNNAAQRVYEVMKSLEDN